MIKEPFFCMCMGAVVSLAACTSTPAMAPSHIAALHSGSMLVVIPKRPYITLASPRDISAGDVATAGVLFGAIGVAIASSVAGSHMSENEEIYSTDMGPYEGRFRSLYPNRQFMDIARSVADHVPWMGKDPSVELYDKPGAPGSGRMSHLAQSSDTQAVVLLKCVTGFSSDMRSLDLVAQVEVYAKGVRRGQLVDGATLEESTRLDSAGPALEPYGYEGIAAGKQNDRAARSARANLWFENEAKRYKAALGRNMDELQAALENYLNGRRSSK